MKKRLFMLAIMAAVGAGQLARAQVSVNVNIGNQPIWGPTGYDYAQYYYLPDLDIYYYVPQQQWVYLQGGRWVSTTTLPPAYRSYDLYKLHKVVINEPQPYLRNQTYRTKYASFRGKADQQPIRDSHDSRYFVIANHPEHAKASGNQRVTAREPRNTPGQRSNQPDRRNGQPGREKGHDRQ